MTKPQTPAIKPERRNGIVPMRMSGFCSFPTAGSHGFCHQKGRGSRGTCDCPCHLGDVPPSSEGFDETIPNPVLAPAPPPTSGREHGVVNPEPAKTRRSPVATRPLRALRREVEVWTARDHRGNDTPLSGPTVKVHLPHRFYTDHVDRDLPGGVVVKVLVQSIYVELDAEAFDDILADCDLYISGGTREFEGYGGLISSAKATVRALNKAGRPA